MGAGKYTERITVERKSDATDAAGVRTEWEFFVTRRADVDAISGRESILHRQVAGTVDYLITLRDDSDTRQITPKMRVVWDEVTLGIVSAIRKGREIELSCKTLG